MGLFLLDFGVAWEVMPIEVSIANVECEDQGFFGIVNLRRV